MLLSFCDIDVSLNFRILSTVTQMEAFTSAKTLTSVPLSPTSLRLLGSTGAPLAPYGDPYVLPSLSVGSSFHTTIEDS